MSVQISLHSNYPATFYAKNHQGPLTITTKIITALQRQSLKQKQKPQTQLRNHLQGITEGMPVLFSLQIIKRIIC